MGGDRDFVEQLRRTKTGYSQRDLSGGLMALGYAKIRTTRHGDLFRSKELAEHPDPQIRMTLAHVLIPRGRDLKRYVAEEVLASVEALLRHREESARGNDG